MSTYAKPHLTYNQQLNQLKQRGMLITDDEVGLRYLARIGYYRLSAYWYPFRIKETTLSSRRSDEFVPGTQLQDVVDLYVFDKKLRLLLLDAIERIEISIRGSIVYLLGEQDPFAHMNKELLHGNFTKKVDLKSNKTDYETWIEKLNKQTTSSREDFVSHFKEKYGLPLPIWVSGELWDFGMLSRFYKGMTVKDKNQIAKEYGVDDFRILESWLRTLNYIRNVCAHHSRLWNRNIVDQPKLPKSGAIKIFDSIIGDRYKISRIYTVLCIIKHLMSIIAPKSSWSDRLNDLLNEFPKNEIISIKAMGAE